MTRTARASSHVRRPLALLASAAVLATAGPLGATAARAAEPVPGFVLFRAVDPVSMTSSEESRLDLTTGEVTRTPRTSSVLPLPSPDGRFGLRVVDGVLESVETATGTRHAIDTVGAGAVYSWSPSGEQVAYLDAVVSESGRPVARMLEVATLDGTTHDATVTRTVDLTLLGGVSTAAFGVARDGTPLVTTRQGLSRLLPDGSTRLLHPGGFDSALGLTVSPVSGLVAFTDAVPPADGGTGPLETGIRVVPEDGSTPGSVWLRGQAARRALWSPDGGELLVARDNGYCSVDKLSPAGTVRPACESHLDALGEDGLFRHLYTDPGSAVLELEHSGGVLPLLPVDTSPRPAAPATVRVRQLTATSVSVDVGASPDASVTSYDVRTARAAQAPAAVQTRAEPGTVVVTGLAPLREHTFSVIARTSSGRTSEVVSRAVLLAPESTTTVSATAAAVVHGAPVRVDGAVRDAAGEPVVADVDLWARPYGASASTRVRRLRTDAEGTVSTLVRPTSRTELQWRYASGTAAGQPLGSRSPLLVVGVAPRVAVASSRSSVPRGVAFSVSGRVQPLLAGRTVALQTGTTDGWRTLRTTRISSAGTYSFAHSVPTPGRQRLRAFVPASPGYLAAVSTPVAVAVG
ncbi:MAG: hypothetical protein JWO60_998 [Frankiales bacterium]|nr:hypothetical protein [Frankiales bacterium]